MGAEVVACGMLARPAHGRVAVEVLARRAHAPVDAAPRPLPRADVGGRLTVALQGAAVGGGTLPRAGFRGLHGLPQRRMVPLHRLEHLDALARALLRRGDGLEDR